MSLILNGTTITAANLNGTAVQSLLLNGTTVFNAYATVTATYATTNGSRWNLNGTDAGSGNVGDNFYTAGITPNAYLDANAKSVGTAKIGSVVGVWDGTYWKPQGDTTKVLSGDFKVQVAVGDIGGVSGNGLIYTGAAAPFNTAYAPNAHFGVTTWSSAVCNSINTRMNSTNICATRKMFLPTYSETQISATNGYNPCGGTGSIGGTGVPNLTSGTWTTTANSGDSNYYWLWNGTNTNDGSYGNLGYVRCVRQVL